MPEICALNNNWAPQKSRYTLILLKFSSPKEKTSPYNFNSPTFDKIYPSIIILAPLTLENKTLPTQESSEWKTLNKSR